MYDRKRDFKLQMWAGGRSWTCAALLGLGITFGLSGGCDDDVRDEFRQNSAAALESGLQSIAQGVISGAFAVVDNSDTATSGSASSSSNP